MTKSHNCSEHSSSVVKEPSFPRDTKAILVPFRTITCPSQVTCTTLLHHSLPVRVCGVSSEPHDQYQIFDRSSLELLLDMLEWKFCCYLSLAEYDPVAFVLFFRFLLIRIVILNTFLIQPLPLHEMKISQSDLWVQTLHKWLLFTRCHPSMFYSVLQLCPSYRQVKCKLHSIHLHSGTLSLFLPHVYWTSEPIH